MLAFPPKFGQLPATAPGNNGCSVLPDGVPLNAYSQTAVFWLLVSGRDTAQMIASCLPCEDTVVKNPGSWIVSGIDPVATCTSLGDGDVCTFHSCRLFRVVPLPQPFVHPPPLLTT